MSMAAKSITITEHILKVIIAEPGRMKQPGSAMITFRMCSVIDLAAILKYTSVLVDMLYFWYTHFIKIHAIVKC